MAESARTAHTFSGETTRAVRAPYSFLALYRRFFSAPKRWVGGWSEGAHIYSFSGARQTKDAEASCRALRPPPDRAPVPRRARGGPARCSVELHTLGAGGKREEGIGTFLSMAFYSALPAPTLPRAVSRARTLLCPWRCCWRCALIPAAVGCRWPMPGMRARRGFFNASVASAL